MGWEREGKQQLYIRRVDVGGITWVITELVTHVIGRSTYGQSVEVEGGSVELG
jgi:hypothetical protein